MLLGVWLLYLAFGLNVGALAPLVPVIEADLGLSHSAMGRVLGAWQFLLSPPYRAAFFSTGLGVVGPCWGVLC